MWKAVRTGLGGCCGVMVLVLVLWSVAWATPVTTKYYSLTLPSDWVVLKGPVRGKDNVILQLSNKARSSTATIVVGSVAPGETSKIIEVYAKRLQAEPKKQSGQTVFFLRHGQERGYCIVREDTRSQLLLIMAVSGELSKADFLFSLRTPYKALLPVRPSLP